MSLNEISGVERAVHICHYDCEESVKREYFVITVACGETQVRRLFVLKRPVHCEQFMARANSLHKAK